MTPHEHYKEAERLLKEAEDPHASDEYTSYLLARAHVHAALAGVVSWPNAYR